MDRGEIFLAPFTYADLQGSKRRPVCIVSSPDFNRGADVIVAMVTSSRRRFDVPTTGDVVLDDWQEAGLLRPSVVRAGRLLVVEVPLLSARLGALSSRDLLAVDSGLKAALGLT
jgi:mRNA interferase MazF